MTLSDGPNAARDIFRQNRELREVLSRLDTEARELSEPQCGSWKR